MPSIELTPSRVEIIADRFQAAGFFVAEVLGSLRGGRDLEAEPSSDFQAVLDTLRTTPGLGGPRFGLIGLDDQAGLALHLAAAFPDSIGALAALGLSDPSLAISGHARDLAERITAQVYVSFEEDLSQAGSQAREVLKRAFRATDVWYEQATGCRPEDEPEHWRHVEILMRCALGPCG